MLTQVQDLNNFYRVFESNSPKSFNEVYGVTGTVAYDLGGGSTLKSISAYRELKAVSTSDPDGTTYALYDQRSPTQQRQFSQELQLAGKVFDEKLTYLIGGYYFRERVRQTLFLCFAPITPVPSKPFNACNTWNQGNNQTTESEAIFGQARYNFTPRLSVTIGGHYTWESKDDISNQAFDFRGAGLQVAPGVIIPGFLSPIVTDRPGHLAFQRFTPKAGLEYKTSNNILAFFSYSRGFRSGGFNGRLIVPQATIPTYRPDTNENYELGIETDLFDRKLRFNLTGFYTQYVAIQQTISVPVIQFQVANAGHADFYGFEAALTAVPVDRLRINAALGYTPSKFNRGSGDPSFAGSPVDIRTGIAYGNKPPFAPEWTPGIGAEHGAGLGSIKVTPRIAYRFQSRTFFTPFNLVYEQQGLLGLLQARITLSDRADKYSVAVFGQNRTDEKYYTFGQNALGAQGVAYEYLGRPREFGNTFGAKF